MRYNVHFYATARIKVSDVEAASPQAAFRQAETALIMEPLSANPWRADLESLHWGEGPCPTVLVDPLGAEGGVVGDGIALDGETGDPLVHGKTEVEHKAQRADSAALFMEEFLDSVGTPKEIATDYSMQTLEDVLYLCEAIVLGTTVKVNTDVSYLHDVLKQLPSCETWCRYVEDMPECA